MSRKLLFEEKLKTAVKSIRLKVQKNGLEVLGITRLHITGIWVERLPRVMSMVSLDNKKYRI